MQAPTPETDAARPPRRIGRSILAIVAGLLVNMILALALDQLFHMLGIYPPWGQPMLETGDNLLAFGYRIAIAILAGYVAARLAPHAPVRHALILGAIGVALSLLGLLGAMQMDMGPLWYPAALVLIALPASWLGGKIYARRPA